MESECKCPEEGGRWTRIRSRKKAGVVQRMKRHHCVCVCACECVGRGERGAGRCQSTSQRVVMNELEFTAAIISHLIFLIEFYLKKDKNIDFVYI